MPGCVLSMLASPARTTGWSSIIMIANGGQVCHGLVRYAAILGLAAAAPRHSQEARTYGRLHFDPGSGAGSTLDYQRGRNTFRSLAHSEQTETRVIAVGDEPLTVVFHGKAEGGALLLKPDPNGAGFGMPDRIGNRFLSNPKKRVLNVDRHNPAVILAIYFHGSHFRS